MSLQGDAWNQNVAHLEPAPAHLELALSLQNDTWSLSVALSELEPSLVLSSAEALHCLLASQHDTWKRSVAVQKAELALVLQLLSQFEGLVWNLSGQEPNSPAASAVVLWTNLLLFQLDI